MLAIEQRDSFPYYSLVVGMKGSEKHPYNLKFVNLKEELQNISQNAAVEVFYSWFIREITLENVLAKIPAAGRLSRMSSNDHSFLPS